MFQRLSAEQQDVYEKLFLQHGLTPRQFSKLCGSARWSDVGRDHVLVEEPVQWNSEKHITAPEKLHNHLKSTTV